MCSDLNENLHTFVDCIFLNNEVSMIIYVCIVFIKVLFTQVVLVLTNTQSLLEIV